MDLPSLPRTPLHRAALLVAFWGAVGLVVATHTYVTLRVRGVPYEPAYAVGAIGGCLVWAGLTPLVAALARRLPPVGRGWPWKAAVHAVAATAFNVAISTLLIAAVLPFDEEPPPFGAALMGTVLTNFLFDLLVYFGVVAAVLAYDASRAAVEARERAREREVRAAQLESQLTGSRLEALRMQLNPHFLFNTLHAISTLMDGDVRSARKVIADLSSLLRVALDRVNEPEVPLDDELDFLGHYLAIERARFRDRLVVCERVGPGLGDAHVPNLILQPLVENALKHAVAPRAGGGRVEVEARRDGDTLVLTVADDGPGLAPGAARGGRGVGLRNTRERLARLYGDGHTFVLRDRDGGGLVAEVRLPYHTSPLPLP